LGQGHGGIFDWTEKLQMVTKVKELNEDKFSKIAKLNLKGRA
jgi:hypothetical protein